jgi:hypothetical protein
MLAPIIDNHVQQALNRLLQQYKGKPRIAALFTALVNQIQDLEDAVYSLNEGRSVYGSVGEQLDLLGTLVGIRRNGLSDDQYRLFILGKIGENTSDTTSDKIAAIYGILLGGAIVQEQDLYPAGVGLLAGGDIDESLWQTVWSMVQLSLGAGIRLEFLGLYNPENPFSFDEDGDGFGDALDLDAGGEFGYLIDSGIDLAFSPDDENPSHDGLGDIEDPVTGGEFIGV